MKKETAERVKSLESAGVLTNPEKITQAENLKKLTSIVSALIQPYLLLPKIWSHVNKERDGKKALGVLSKIQPLIQKLQKLKAESDGFGLESQEQKAAILREQLELLKEVTALVQALESISPKWRDRLTVPTVHVQPSNEEKSTDKNEGNFWSRFPIISTLIKIDRNLAELLKKLTQQQKPILPEKDKQVNIIKPSEKGWDSYYYKTIILSIVEILFAAWSITWTGIPQLSPLKPQIDTFYKTVPPIEKVFEALNVTSLQIQTALLEVMPQISPFNLGLFGGNNNTSLPDSPQTSDPSNIPRTEIAQIKTAENQWPVYYQLHFSNNAVQVGLSSEGKIEQGQSFLFDPVDAQSLRVRVVTKIPYEEKKITKK